MVTSLGGTADHDGTPMVMGMCHFTPSTPVEIVETEYPIRIRIFDIWQDSAGAGRTRGGIGFVREYEMLSKVILTARTANHQQPGWGRRRRRAASLRNVAQPGWPRRDRTGSAGYEGSSVGNHRPVGSDGRQRIRRSETRDAARVLDDVRNGYISVRSAEEKYGVVIVNGEIDTAATDAKRRA